MGLAAHWAALQPQIAYYIRQHVNDWALTEDLTSLVFVKALEAEQAGKGARTHLSGWLFRIAHNLIIDHYRRRERERKRIVSIDEVLGLAHRSTPETEFEAAWQSELLDRSLGQLVPNQAQIMRLRNAGYEFEEIARLLDTTEGAVKAARHRALLNLRVLATLERAHGYAR